MRARRVAACSRAPGRSPWRSSASVSLVDASSAPRASTAPGAACGAALATADSLLAAGCDAVGVGGSSRGGGSGGVLIDSAALSEPAPHMLCEAKAESEAAAAMTSTRAMPSWNRGLRPAAMLAACMPVRAEILGCTAADAGRNNHKTLIPNKASNSDEGWSGQLRARRWPTEDAPRASQSAAVRLHHDRHASYRLDRAAEIEPCDRHCTAAASSATARQARSQSFPGG